MATMVESVEDLRRMVGDLLECQENMDSRIFDLFKQQIEKRDMIPSEEETIAILEWCFKTAQTMDQMGKNAGG